ncbi:helix-turn-helix domain-containing protein [Mariprofundus erugo]|uniref:Helix-turn-helix domain-containing protein n=1 Tax=Mariprofundus erugo TaxID=2528639 RepID=A0A5R9GMJ4_9PROT|nr:helix-turn-helix domain-containing protein [Mariprofundus erugo]TLS66189.1 helix-turn-helix domain-containing protein [Mariprofundus erugo]
MMEYKVAIAQQLSTQLKTLRKQAGLTQQQLGEKLGVSQRVIARNEAHPEKVHFERILQMLSALDADLIIRERKSANASNRTPEEESW